MPSRSSPSRACRYSVNFDIVGNFDIVADHVSRNPLFFFFFCLFLLFPSPSSILPNKELYRPHTRRVITIKSSGNRHVHLVVEPMPIGCMHDSCACNPMQSDHQFTHGAHSPIPPFPPSPLQADEVLTMFGLYILPPKVDHRRCVLGAGGWGLCAVDCDRPP